jgi:hypothetical protein
MIGYGPNYSSGFNVDSPIQTITFAALGPALPAGTKRYVTDVGEYGAEYISNGSAWVHGGEIEIIQKAKGWIVPSLAAADAATYSQTGTTITVTSVGHNIPAENYDTKDVYLNMGAAATGATIPPGWFSNFTRTSADTFTCVSTISQTGTGTVNTNISVTPVNELSSTIIGGILRPNGVTDFSFTSSNNNSAGIKSVLFWFGIDQLSFDNTTTIVLQSSHNLISNRNNEAKQVFSFGGNVAVGTQNTAVDVPCIFSLQCAQPNDYIAIHAASVYILPS